LVALFAIGATFVSGGSRVDSVRYRYLPETNALRTVSLYGKERAVTVRSLGDPGLVVAHPRWLAAARPLGAGAPGWALSMYRRSLLVLRALTDRRTGAVLAGARDGWAYVWPRDAGAAAIALSSAGYRAEARRIVRFLLSLDLDAAARFHRDGTPVEGRAAQGDAAGWVTAAARAVGLRAAVPPQPWRGRADYQEGDPGDYLANAIASTVADGPKTVAYRRESARRQEATKTQAMFETPGARLVRRAGDPGSGVDSAAAWAVRPFALPALYPLARRSLLRLAARSGRYGIVPSEDWDGGEDPWTAPTAWTAWSLAALGERRAALRLMAALRRAATPLGMLPERVDARTGIPTSTTPLAWSHAFAILALRELWPRRAGL
jgi:GH15 family glucan-1,4-alpha-glucosidase